MESAFCLRIPYIFLRISFTFCGIDLQLRNPEQLAIFACCGIRNKTIVPTKLTLQLFVRGIHEIFVSGIYLLFGTCLKICPWNPGTYRHKILRLSSAQIGLVMFEINNPVIGCCHSTLEECRFCFQYMRFSLFVKGSKHRRCVTRLSN